MLGLLQNIINSSGEVIIAALSANFAAQLFKVVVQAYKRRKFNFALFFATGGMPSSHSSTVTAMATSVGLISGFDSTVFAVAALVAGIVMYDAAGLRRAASKQAIVLNQIVQQFFSNTETLQKEKLKEFLGHTPRQVLAGAVLGVVFSLLLHRLLHWSIAHLIAKQGVYI